MSLKIDLNEPKILEKVTSDRFGLLVSQEWKRIIDPYTPRDTGTLMGLTNQVDLQPFKIWYKSEYAEEVYYNRRGVEFIQGQEGNGRNPSATDHWDIKAAKSGQLDKLYRILNTALQSGRF